MELEMIKHFNFKFKFKFKEILNMGFFSSVCIASFVTHNSSVAAATDNKTITSKTYDYKINERITDEKDFSDPNTTSVKRKYSVQLDPKFKESKYTLSLTGDGSVQIDNGKGEVLEFGTYAGTVQNTKIGYEITESTCAKSKMPVDCEFIFSYRSFFEGFYKIAGSDTIKFNNNILLFTLSDSRFSTTSLDPVTNTKSNSLSPLQIRCNRMDWLPAGNRFRVAEFSGEAMDQNPITLENENRMSDAYYDMDLQKTTPTTLSFSDAKFKESYFSSLHRIFSGNVVGFTFSQPNDSKKANSATAKSCHVAGMHSTRDYLNTISHPKYDVTAIPKNFSNIKLNSSYRDGLIEVLNQDRFLKAIYALSQAKGQSIQVSVATKTENVSGKEFKTETKFILSILGIEQLFSSN
jgi:hypothetical protein